MQKDDLSKKLAQVGEQIEQAKKKLQHHGIFSNEHKVTQGALDARYHKLESELNSEVNDLEKHHKHIGDLEDTLLEWMNSIDFDFG